LPLLKFQPSYFRKIHKY